MLHTDKRCRQEKQCCSPLTQEHDSSMSWKLGAPWGLQRCAPRGPPLVARRRALWAPGQVSGLITLHDDGRASSCSSTCHRHIPIFNVIGGNRDQGEKRTSRITSFSTTLPGNTHASDFIVTGWETKGASRREGSVENKGTGQHRRGDLGAQRDLQGPAGHRSRKHEGSAVILGSERICVRRCTSTSSLTSRST